MLKPCCEWMENALSTAGQKGLGILPFRNDQHRTFFLQARPFESDFDRKVAGIPDGIPIALAINASIRFCPHCGTELAGLIAAQQQEFDRSAEAAAHLIPWK